MSATLYDIPIANIITFLDAEGWNRVEDDNERWFVYEGQADAAGDSFEIVLPKNSRSPGYPVYVMHTIEILSSLADKSHEFVLQEIQSVCRDVLLVRVDNSADARSVPMNLVAKQIPNLKQLVAYAACSEKSQRAHYRDSSQGKAMAEHFRFGHTVAGSFGYRVESTIGEKILFHEDSEQLRQLEIFVDQEIEEVPPLERRVMERIVRGLAATAETANVENVAPLVDGYYSGFNANMCHALLEISKGHEETIEYNVSWSKKFPVPLDVAQHSNIRIDRTHFDYLRDARKILMAEEPEKISVEGRVTALSSEDDPRSDDAEHRSIIVRVTSGRFKSRKLRIALGKRAYERADKAHMDWNTISVTGVMRQIGANWHLSDPNDFRVIR